MNEKQKIWVVSQNFETIKSIHIEQISKHVYAENCPSTNSKNLFNKVDSLDGGFVCYDCTYNNIVNTDACFDFLHGSIGFISRDDAKSYKYKNLLLGIKLRTNHLQLQLDQVEAIKQKHIFKYLLNCRAYKKRISIELATLKHNAIKLGRLLQTKKQGNTK